MVVAIDLTAEKCPCCSAERRATPQPEWPWECECRECPVAGMGWTCANPCKCWANCPHRAIKSTHTAEPAAV